MVNRDTDDGTRRTVEELAQLYEVEPVLSEIITEGRTDAAVIRWFLAAVGSDASVYAIMDRVKISPAIVRSHGQTSGNRGAVIATAQILSQIIDSRGPGTYHILDRVTFIYDRDDDNLSGTPSLTSRCLLPSDYTSLEMYCFSERPLSKLLEVPLRANGVVTADAVLSAITTALVIISVARFILRSLPRSIKLVSRIESRCKVSAADLQVDLRSLVEDSVNSAGGAKKCGSTTSEIETTIKDAVASLSMDPRQVIRGHDFTELLCYFLRTRFPALFRDDRQAFKNSAVFANVLITCLEHNDLMHYELFANLLSRHSPTAE